MKQVLIIIWINSEKGVSKNLAETPERNYGQQERQLSLNLVYGKCKWYVLLMQRYSSARRTNYFSSHGK
jgi:hypothetical protein